MPRIRALLAILVLLAGGVLAAGCARTDQPSAGAPDPTVTTPPPTSATPSTVTPSPTTPTPAPGPLLVWPATTAVAVTRPVTVPPVPLLVHVRSGQHPGYDRIVFEFAGPIPSYRVRPVTGLAEDGSGMRPSGRDPPTCSRSAWSPPRPTPTTAGPP